MRERVWGRCFGVAPPELAVTTYGAACDVLAVAGRAAGLALIMH